MSNTAAQAIISGREDAEEVGGWLPLFVAMRCFYCGYALSHGHDYDCLYLTNCYNLGRAGHVRGTGTDRQILVPVGGLQYK